MPGLHRESGPGRKAREPRPLYWMDGVCSAPTRRIALKSGRGGQTSHGPTGTPGREHQAHLWELGAVWFGGRGRRHSARVVSSDFSQLTDLKSVQDLLAGSSYP